MTVHVLGRWSDTEGMPAFDVTSQRPFMPTTRPIPTLSPFSLGPVQLYDEHYARNMENGWQYAKVYGPHVGSVGPNGNYWAWALQGWDNSRAVRYPMGKGAVPLYSWWCGDKLGYIAARKRIYIPLYSHAVWFHQATVYRWLQDQHNEHGDIAVLDYDAYDRFKLGYSWSDVVNDPERKMGHGFVLAMMLEGVI